MTWAVTAVLLFSGSYQLLQAIRSRHLTEQANKALHALMNVLMAAMLWNLGASTMLAQIALLAGAALWFVIQAVARPEFKILCEGSQGRLKCLYHALSMAGAALMIAIMGGHVGNAGHGIPQAAGMSMPNAHHSMPAAAPTAAAGFDQAAGLTILLTVFFGAAALVFTFLLLRSAVNTFRRKVAPKLTVRAEHGLEALGAAVMALMFVSMA
jgi:hypothetical protein